MDSLIHSFLQTLSIPWIGLSSVGILSFLSATLIPFSSEAVFFGYLVKFPENVWALIGVATVGNSLGGHLTGGWDIFLKRPKMHSKKKQTPHPSRAGSII